MLSFQLVCLIHVLESQVSHNIRPTADFVYTETDIVKHTSKSEDSNLWTWWTTDSQDDEYSDQSRMFKYS